MGAAARERAERPDPGSHSRFVCEVYENTIYSFPGIFVALNFSRRLVSLARHLNFVLNELSLATLILGYVPYPLGRQYEVIANALSMMFVMHHQCTVQQ